jgi:alpha-glucosidase (family GH31 glycosyl hydrolase)
MEAFFRHAHERREAEGVDFWWVDWQQDHLKPVIKGTRLRHLPWLNHCYYAHSEKDGKRGASFSRFGGIGDHKHPIFFSGDTRATWECLAFEIAFTASSSNAGLFYWGHDTEGSSEKPMRSFTCVGRNFPDFPPVCAHIPNVT